MHKVLFNTAIMAGVPVKSWRAQETCEETLPYSAFLIEASETVCSRTRNAEVSGVSVAARVLPC